MDNSLKAQLEKDRLLRDILEQVLAEIKMEITCLKYSACPMESSTQSEVQDLQSRPMGINALVSK